MPHEQRKELIARLEKLRESRVLSYVIPDRESFPPGVPGFSTQLSIEPQLLLADHLRAIGKVKRIDLFLYTRGGATDCVWPLVSLLREYCERLSVLVPFRAHSAGTLICLGADEIVMSDIGQLSPIDPATGNQFNPVDPGNPQSRLGISVEDVAAYFELSETRAGITKEEHKVDALKELTRQVHPLALGNVQRVYMMIRSLARRLLSMHMSEDSDGKRMDAIIKGLTEDFRSHTHAISRREAISLLGDWVRAPEPEEGEAMWALFDQYATDLQLREKFNLPVFMGDEPVKDLDVIGGIVESRAKAHSYRTGMRVIQRPNLPPGVQIQVPPGSPVPLIPGFSRTFEQSILKMSWVLDGVGA